MNDHQQQLKTIAELKKNFDQLLQINNDSISKIPIEMMPDKTAILNDIGKIQKMVNKLDKNGLNKMFKKYSQNAGSNTK
jgi:hypothetical protein